jgi:hypothetical protein
MRDQFLTHPRQGSRNSGIWLTSATSDDALKDLEKIFNDILGESVDQSSKLPQGPAVTPTPAVTATPNPIPLSTPKNVPNTGGSIGQ